MFSIRKLNKVRNSPSNHKKCHNCSRYIRNLKGIWICLYWADDDCPIDLKNHETLTQKQLFDYYQEQLVNQDHDQTEINKHHEN